MCAGNQRITCAAVAGVPEPNSGLAIGSPTEVSTGTPTIFGASLNSGPAAKTGENAENAEKGREGGGKNART